MPSFSWFLTSSLTTIVGSLGAMFTAVIATKGDAYVGYIWQYLLTALGITLLGSVILVALAYRASKH